MNIVAGPSFPNNLESSNAPYPWHSMPMTLPNMNPSPPNPINVEPLPNVNPFANSPNPVPQKNTVEMTRDMLFSVLECFSELLPYYFDLGSPVHQGIQLTVHGGACMLLHSSLCTLFQQLHQVKSQQSQQYGSQQYGTYPTSLADLPLRTTTRDVDIIMRGFIADYSSLTAPSIIRYSPGGPGDLTGMAAAKRLVACIEATARRFSFTHVRGKALGADWMNSDPDIALPMAIDPQTNQQYDPVYTSSKLPNNVELHTVFKSKNGYLKLVSVAPYWSVALKLARYRGADIADIAVLLRNGMHLNKVHWTPAMLESWLNENCWSMGYAMFDHVSKAQIGERMANAIGLLHTWDDALRASAWNPNVNLQVQTPFHGPNGAGMFQVPVVFPPIGMGASMPNGPAPLPQANLVQDMLYDKRSCKQRSKSRSSRRSMKNTFLSGQQLEQEQEIFIPPPLDSDEEEESNDVHRTHNPSRGPVAQGMVQPPWAGNASSWIPRRRTPNRQPSPAAALTAVDRPSTSTAVTSWNPLSPPAWPVVPNQFNVVSQSRSRRKDKHRRKGKLRKQASNWDLQEHDYQDDSDYDSSSEEFQWIGHGDVSGDEGDKENRGLSSQRSQHFSMHDPRTTPSNDIGSSRRRRPDIELPHPPDMSGMLLQSGPFPLPTHMSHPHQFQEPNSQLQRLNPPQFQQMNPTQFQQPNSQPQQMNPQFQQPNPQPQQMNPQFQQPNPPQFQQMNPPQFQQPNPPQFHQTSPTQFQQTNHQLNPLQFQQTNPAQFQQANPPQFQQTNLPQFQQTNPQAQIQQEPVPHELLSDRFVRRADYQFEVQRQELATQQERLNAMRRLQVNG